jgi:hypothetical protein
MDHPAPSSNEPSKKLGAKAHILSGWPLLLVAIGGLIGGALGGLAYVTNLKVYQSNLPIAAKIGINLCTGTLAFILWVVAILLIRPE